MTRRPLTLAGHDTVETLLQRRYHQQAHLLGRDMRDAGLGCPESPEAVADGWQLRDDEIHHDEVRRMLRGDVDPDATIKVYAKGQS